METWLAWVVALLFTLPFPLANANRQGHGPQVGRVNLCSYCSGTTPAQASVKHALMISRNCMMIT